MNLQTFNELLDSSFDFEGLSEEEKENAREELKNLIFENTLLRIMDKRDLTMKQFQSFQKNVLSEDSVEKRIEYLNREFPEFTAYISQEINDLQFAPAV